MTRFVMRTTLSVADDLLILAKQRAAEWQIPRTQVINRALRKGLAEDNAPRLASPTVVYGDPSIPGPDDQALRAWQHRLDDASAQDAAGLSS